MSTNKLIEYLPLYVQNYTEIKEITNSEQFEFDLLWDEKERILNNSFVMYADDEGLRRYEDMLGMVKKPSENLEDRKFNIIVKMNEQLPYSIRALENKLKNLCGEDGYFISLKHNTYTINIKVALTARNNLKAVQEMVKRVIPCNLVIVVTLAYNQHESLTKYTHSQLAEFTHKHIRNEVL